MFGLGHPGSQARLLHLRANRASVSRVLAILAPLALFDWVAFGSFGIPAALAQPAAAHAQPHPIPAAAHLPPYPATAHTKAGPKVAVANNLLAFRAEAGSVLVTTTIDAKLTVPALSINSKALGDLESQLASQVSSGKLGSDTNTISQALTSAIDAQPLTYLSPSSPNQTINASVTEIGSGWFASPDGLVVAPSSLVAPSPALLKEAFARYSLVSLDKTDADLLRSGAGGSLTPSQLSQLDDAASKFNASFMAASNIKTQTSIRVWTLGHGGPAQSRGTWSDHEVTLIHRGSVIKSLAGGIAVLKARGISSQPTILPVISKPNAWANFNRTLPPIQARHNSPIQATDRSLTLNTQPKVFGYLTAPQWVSSSGALSKLSGNTLGSLPVQPAKPNAADSGSSPIVDPDGAIAFTANGEFAGIQVDSLSKGSIDPELLRSTASAGLQAPEGYYLLSPPTLLQLIKSAYGPLPIPESDKEIDSNLGDIVHGRLYTALPALENLADRNPDIAGLPTLVSLTRNAIADGNDHSPVTGWGIALAALALGALALVALRPTRKMYNALGREGQAKPIFSRARRMPATQSWARTSDHLTTQPVSPDPNNSVRLLEGKPGSPESLPDSLV